MDMKRYFVFEPFYLLWRCRAFILFYIAALIIIVLIGRVAIGGFNSLAIMMHWLPVIIASLMPVWVGTLFLVFKGDQRPRDLIQNKTLSSYLRIAWVFLLITLLILCAMFLLRLPISYYDVLWRLGLAELPVQINSVETISTGIDGQAITEIREHPFQMRANWRPMILDWLAIAAILCATSLWLPNLFHAQTLRLLDLSRLSLSCIGQTLPAISTLLLISIFSRDLLFWYLQPSNFVTYNFMYSGTMNSLYSTVQTFFFTLYFPALYVSATTNAYKKSAAFSD